MSLAHAPRKASRAVATIVGLSMLSGCYASFDIPVEQAPRLAGSVPVHEVTTLTGEPRTLDNSFKVRVIPLDPDRPGGRPVTFGAPLKSEIRDGLLIMQGQRDPTPMTFPLNRIETIQIRQLSAGGTAGLVVGVVAGGATFLVGLVFGVFLLARSSASQH